MLLTIDIGTSTFKSALWSCENRRLSYASVPLSISDVQKHEADPSQWLYAFSRCCKKLGSLKKVEAIIISGNGPSLVPVLGEPVFKNGLHVPAAASRLWLDRRAVEYQADVSKVMGGFVDASFFLPKILYIKNKEPQLYEKTKFFLGCPEYLAYALTSRARTVFPCDGYDRWFWNDTVLEKFKLEREKFPEYIRPGEQFGTITSDAARYFGFRKNICVVSGGPDFFAAILGSGVTAPGQACNRSGSSEGINLCMLNRPRDSRLLFYAHPVKPYWNLSGNINTTGKAIQWGSDLLGIENINDFIKTAQKSEAGSGGLVFLPYLAGERAPVWKSAVRASWNGITLSAGRGEFANSILESIGFAIRDVTGLMEEAGGRIEELRVTGGLSGCERLNQIKANITGIEVLEGEYRETELLGLAIIGGCFTGRYSSLREASSSNIKIKRRYEPNHKNNELYKGLFCEYVKMRNNSSSEDFT
ncbi:MAG: FGGY-family carbohydrate kinase [Treponema sp.]|nr:FGGY-family carbohydrate kinase [Treponema sp.]